MNKGFRGWSRPRNRVFVGDPQVIDTTNGNTFLHGFGRVPGIISVTLKCVTDNNGYVAGDEIPIQMVSYDGGATDNDGWSNWQYHADIEKVFTLMATETSLFRSTTGTRVSWVAAEWKVLVRCRDIERLT